MNHFATPSSAASLRKRMSKWSCWDNLLHYQPLFHERGSRHLPNSTKDILVVTRVHGVHTIHDASIPQYSLTASSPRSSHITALQSETALAVNSADCSEPLHLEPQVSILRRLLQLHRKQADSFCLNFAGWVVLKTLRQPRMQGHLPAFLMDLTHVFIDFLLLGGAYSSCVLQIGRMIQLYIDSLRAPTTFLMTSSPRSGTPEPSSGTSHDPYAQFPNPLMGQRHGAGSWGEVN